MPIESDNNYVTLEFQYTAAEDPNIKMTVKYHHVDGKPMISITEDKEQWYDLPASLFPDVTDHLRERNLLAQAVNSRHPQPQQFASAATIVRTGPYVAHPVESAPSPSSLPVPQIENATLTQQPIESFAGLAALAARTTVPSQTSAADDDAMKSRSVIKGDEASAGAHRKAMGAGKGGIKRSS